MKKQYGVPVETTWTVGFKKANLVIDRSGTIWFMSIKNAPLGPAVYGAKADAKCLSTTNFIGKWEAHRPPAEDCYCGFNALAKRADAELYVWDTGARALYEAPVMMRVGLKGDKITGKLDGHAGAVGYRAEIQEVQDVFVPMHCGAAGCIEQTLELGVLIGDEAPTHSLRNYRYLRPLCASHCRNASVRLTLEVCSRKLAVSFHWDTGPTYAITG